MCGIAGFVDFKGSKIDMSLLKQATDAISHRGPDGEGHWLEDNIGIGHRRLSIIDLSDLAAQPMVSKDQRYVLSYNGEIYNFKELRNELKNQNVIFHSESDTEVVLNALSLWGSDALIKFNGMFSLAFFDRKSRKLLLARDRYGIKPLYYSEQNDFFSFASEQKSIFINPNFNNQVNIEALYEYFTFQNIFTDQTLLNDINILPSGCYLEVSALSGEKKLTRYWDYHFAEPNNPLNKEEYLEELKRLFKQSVKRQLVSDVELGSYLSGGMDSGSITAISSDEFKNLKTFTCGFDLSSASGIELAFDERQKAEAMSAKFKTEHYEMVLKSGDMERCLTKLAWHLEDPRVGQSYPNYYAAQLASKFVKVVLSGSGGDELFGGYPWRYYRAASSQNFEEFIDKYYLYWQRLINNTQLKKLFRPVSGEVKNVWTRDIFRDIFKTHQNELNNAEDYINHSLYFEAKTFLHGLFIVEDKLSMAHSLESRVPFMDNDLVDFAMKCPVNLKLNNLSDVIRINENDPGLKKSDYFKKTNDGKQILRDMMTSYVPEDIVKAQKQGFSSPDASWFKGESIDFVKKEIYNSSAPIFDFIDMKETHSIVDQHLSGKKNSRLFIWSLLNVNAWLRQI
jgi:asparagine synthase (glutamine-hydrolysing)